MRMVSNHMRTGIRRNIACRTAAVRKGHATEEATNCWRVSKRGMCDVQMDRWLHWKRDRRHDRGEAAGNTSGLWCDKTTSCFMSASRAWTELPGWTNRSCSSCQPVPAAVFLQQSRGRSVSQIKQPKCTDDISAVTSPQRLLFFFVLAKLALGLSADAPTLWSTLKWIVDWLCWNSDELTFPLVPS